MYSVRFHLGRGPNFRHWQVRNLSNKSSAPLFLDPSEFQLHLHNCKLVRSESKAKKVFSSGVKDVCGWIRCDSFDVVDVSQITPDEVAGLDRVSFNPIMDTEWRIEGRSGSFSNQDVGELVTAGSRVYISPALPN